MSTEELDDRLSDFFASKCCNVKLFSGELPLTGKKGILYVSEDGEAFVWNGSTYISIGGSTVEFFTGSPPVSGESGIIYVDQDSGAIYVWDGAAMVTGSASLQEDITYAELVSAISASELIPGLRYRITDYATTHYIVDSANTQYPSDIITGSTEPLIVTAISTSELSLIAESEDNPLDIIYYDWNPVNRLSSKFFAISSVIIPGFTGAITYRNDTAQGNSTTYDFRVVKFRRWKHNAPTYSAGTSYGQNAFSNDGSFLYISKASGNIGNALTDETKWQKLDVIGNTEYIMSSPSAVSYPPADPAVYTDYLTFQPMGTSIYADFTNNTIKRGFSDIVTNNVIVAKDGGSAYGNVLDNCTNNIFIHPTANNFKNASKVVFGGGGGNSNSGTFSTTVISDGFNNNAITQYLNFSRIGLAVTDNIFGYIYGSILGSSCVKNNISYMNLSSFKSSFQYNELKNPFTGLNSVQLNTATHVYAAYTTVGYKNASLQNKITYLDALNVLTAVDITA